MDIWKWQQLTKLAMWGALATISATNLFSATYNYTLQESLPCIRNCSGNLAVSGTITVNQLGTLGTANFTNWSLAVGNFTDTPITLVPTNSSLTLSGSVLITAATDALTFKLSQSGDGFSFMGLLPGKNADFVYGFGGGSEYITYPLNGDGQVAFRTLTLPATFTARSFAVESGVPEPSSWLLTLGGLALVGLARRRTMSLRATRSSYWSVRN